MTRRTLTQRTFGENLRAARLRFTWHEQLRSWIRITQVDDDEWRVLAVPNGQLNGREGPKGVVHAVMDDAELHEMAQLCGPLRRLLEAGQTVQTRTVWHCGPDGESLGRRDDPA